MLRKKKWKNITKFHFTCVKNEEKTVKGVKMHDRETVTFRNSEIFFDCSPHRTPQAFF